MLHYATPALNHLYFVDPQWLCDMLAHIVTVPEVNRFIPRKDSKYPPRRAYSDILGCVHVCHRYGVCQAGMGATYIII